MFSLDAPWLGISSHQVQTQLAVVLDNESDTELEESSGGGQLACPSADQALDKLQSEMDAQFDNLLAAVTSIPDATAIPIGPEKEQERAKAE